MLIRDLGIIPARKASDGAGEASPLVNLSRRGFMEGALALGATVAGAEIMMGKALAAPAKGGKGKTG